MSSFSCVQDLLARRLWAVGAVKDKMHPDAVQRPSGERGFLLKLHEKDPDAPLSPVYFNLRTPGNPKPGPLVPAIVEIAGRALYAHCYQGGASVAEPNFRLIAGVPNAGDPFADAFAAVFNEDQVSNVPIIRMGKQTAPDGSRQVLGITNGGVSTGSSVFLVDDLITGADSKLEAVKVIQNAGGCVYDVAVLLDREQGGAQELRRRGINLHSVFKISELLAFYAVIGLMARGTYDEIMAYIKANSTG
ncbi:MAG: Bifunctional UMP-synthetase [Candidatus Magasanikbacteria bacterium GW2011_GWA2_46_17]|uniref:Bifunctional UMP-synthetase n=1 Tax=Candidatus Magasanikbacteria bacterium GW2011_GWA2_46_17 TaxID=1619042 RepID=A0A0G1P2V9_9BACT|nr:MAG: Bifunctional UMP-synthetase [Candidatus Magasanikbacteria bacterium GW2011_GWA2_46_17]HBF67158.1 hypothetical protein [Candidatus Magasanikbacteria bacterium]